MKRGFPAFGYWLCFSFLFVVLADCRLSNPGSDVPSIPDLAAEDDSGLSDSDDITNVTTGLTFTGTGVEPGSTVRLYDSAGVLGSATADASGNWSVDITVDEGIYNISARTTNAEEIESLPSEVLTLTVDTTAPSGTANLLRPRNGDNTGADLRPSFVWTGAADAASYDIQVDDSSTFASINYDWTQLAGTSYTPDSDLLVSASVPVGTRYYYRIRAADAAGNAGAWNAAQPLRYVNVGRYDADFNGDGSSDVIVGGYSYNSNQGRARIYFGDTPGAAMNGGPDVDMTGETTGDYFGTVASAGDVNADGYCDAIVGANFYNTYQGRAYIYLGGPTMDAVADLILTGEFANTGFGLCVASDGDVNGDGYGDVIVGAYMYDGSIGRAYVLLGGAAMNAIADIIMTGEAASSNFGDEVASAGDVNGDGYGDTIVGAYRYSSNLGRAYIYYGGATMNNIADLTMTGEPSGTSFGIGAAGAGDVNGDGYDDAIVSANGYNGDQGRAYLYLGGPAMDATAEVVMNGEAASTSFGRSVAGGDDLNGDGYDDVIVGASAYNSFQGRAFVFFGASSMDATADLTMTGEAANNYFGDPVIIGGDLNRDGYADALVGADAYNGTQGRVYIYRGGSAMNSAIDVILTGEVGDHFGCSVY